MVFVIIIIINYLVMRLIFPGPEEPVTIPYTYFKQQVVKGNVSAIYSKGTSIEGRFAAPIKWPPFDEPKDVKKLPSAPRDSSGSQPRQADTFTTELPAFVDPGLEQFLIDHKVEISALPIKPGSPWATLLFGFGPALLIILFYVWLYRRASQAGGMGGALMGIGRSKARRYDASSESKVTFNDVAGIDEAENERMHLMTFIEIAQPSRFERLLVLLVQGVFFNCFFLLYLVSPKTAHRVVGYFEEEAIVSYNSYLAEIDAGNHANVPAPRIAIDYWKLPADATLRDVVIAVRADEAEAELQSTGFGDSLEGRRT